MNQPIKNLSKIILSVLLICCLLKMPYAYFQFVRFIGMAIFLLLAFSDKDKDNKTLMIIWLLSAVLIQPFLKVALGREIWNIIDVVWAIILIFSIFESSNIKEKSNEI